MARFPALPLWTDAYLADTGHLTDVEHGRYLLLLMQMWKSPKCRLPNDDAWLARRFNRTIDAVRAELRPVIREFMRTDGNWIRQKRLAREYLYVTATSKKRSDAANIRWNKKKGVSPAYAPIPIQERDSFFGESQSKNGAQKSGHQASKNKRRMSASQVITEATTRARVRREH